MAIGQPAPPPPSTPAAPMTATQVIAVLDQTVHWHRTLAMQQQSATEPSDTLALYENRQIADQVLKLAFESARANADMLAKRSGVAPGNPDAASSMTRLAQFRGKLEAQRQSAQGELEQTRRQLMRARGAQKADLQSKISELQGELDLIDAQTNLLGTMSQFVGGSGSGLNSDALKAQIDAMAVALPASDVAAAGTTAAPGTPAAAAPAHQPPSASAPGTRFGIWDLGADVVRLWEKGGTITDVDRDTAALQATLDKYRTPLIDRMKGLIARGDALAAQADSATGAALGAMRGQFESLSDDFKQTAALLIPLSKEEVLLKQYRRNLGNWQDGVKIQKRDALQRLAVRLAVLAVFLTLVFAAAELWHRAVFRYIKDSRRRQQLLLMRKIALWTLVLVIVGLAFASELGSIATFAGLITAGVAVAMQSVLVSIVGYFFLIGKYGIRVGDRVQIGEVTGEVIDVGLVRLYLMELGAHGSQGPTGRVVAFANSIVFQVASGLFKQIPGVNFAWHEITLALPAGADYAAVKDQILAAVVHALADFRKEIDRQTQEIQRTTAASSPGDANPQVQLRFSSAGVEALIRYPVHLLHAAEIDERVSREVLDVISAHGPAGPRGAAPQGLGT
jgi:small-conductance mechanosensitive channel